MATNVDINGTSMTAQQLAGHLEGLVKCVKDGSFGQKHFEALAEGRDPFAQVKSVDVYVNERVEWWRYHFKNLYQINPDFSNLYIPAKVAGFDRLVIILKGLTHQKWVETARTIHEVYLYNDDLDGTVTVNDRVPERSYGIWMRDRREADEELKGKLTIVLEKEKIQGITLRERLVMGTGYLFEKMSHPDQESITLCSGSRDSDGFVPYVYWNTCGRGVYVTCYVPSLSSSLRARAVVS